ncbi:hypothetical protein OE88DRAFT_1620188 [Heliocybe sulcata]|uniref:ATP-dependent DNA helicase n=1 Tax=Heliocybe sulcata TaxID=5364 RepID=A0A5C3NLA0_9AGAM|nr:hypothetical protein OE88DRAFT_1620188 [Heliocybe sulcata]
MLRFDINIHEAARLLHTSQRCLRHPRYYAVKRGRDGRQIYTSWDQVVLQTHRIPGIGYETFLAKTQAGVWPSEPTQAVGKDAEAGIVDSNDAEENIVLSEEQRQILRMVQRGESVFFTGSAGTGKSVLLREIIRSCKGQGMRIGEELAVTAATGIASINIGGKTLHSWAGIGLGQEDPEGLAFDIESSSLRSPSHKGERKYPPSPLERWQNVRTLIVDESSLSRPQRTVLFLMLRFLSLYDRWDVVGQAHFVDILNTLRIGKVTEEIVDELRQLSRPVTYTDGIEPTELYPLRRDVEIANHNRLTALPTSEMRYLAVDARQDGNKGYKISLEAMERALGRLVAQQEVVLKNVPGADLVNGSQGLVVDFMTVRQAWGEMISDLEIGHAKDRTVLYGELLDKERPQWHAMLQDDTLWPLVKFTNGRTMLCTPAEFNVNNFKGEAEATRRQVPLICAWAMSVHRSQGQTLERVRVDLGQAFEYGQGTLYGLNLFIG